MNYCTTETDMPASLQVVNKKPSPSVMDNTISCHIHADFPRMTFEKSLLKKYNINRRDVEIIRPHLTNVSFLTALSSLILNRGDLVSTIVSFNDVPHYSSDDFVIYETDIAMIQAECQGASYVTCLNLLKMHRGNMYDAILHYRSHIFGDSMDIDQHPDDHLLKKREREDDDTPNKKRKLTL